jgi:hypothetical protein
MGEENKADKKPVKVVEIALTQMMRKNSRLEEPQQRKPWEQWGRKRETRTCRNRFR